MKKKIIIIVSVILAIALIIGGIFVFTPKVKLDKKVISDNIVKAENKVTYLEGEPELSDEDYTLIGEAGVNQLYYNQSDYTFKVKNKVSGLEWSTMMDESEFIFNEEMGKTENPPVLKNRLKRLFDVSYTNFKEITETTSLIENYNTEVTYSKLKNGIAINSKFVDPGISVTLEAWVDENGFNVRIPRNKIKEENKEYGIVNLSLLPMFGAVSDKTTNGFVLFPNVNGSIYNIKKIEGRQSPVTTDIYFPRDFSIDDIMENNKQGFKNAIMPFFGSSKGNKGMVGYITEGEMNGYITFNPSTFKYKYNTIVPSVNYRKSYSYLNPAGEEVTETERGISARDYAVHYSFAEPEKDKLVNYSDLANILRKYLVDSKLLVKADEAKKPEINVNIQTIMSVKVDSMVGKFLQVMTSGEDVENFIGGLDDKARDKMRFLFIGWQSSGANISPSTGKAARGIGSLKNMFDAIKKNNSDGYLLDDYVSASIESKNFSKQNDAVFNEAKIPVTDKEGKLYVRNPYKEYKKYVEKTLPYFEKNNVIGSGLDKIGWYCFDDYQKNVEVDRYGTSAIYAGMIKKTRDAGMKVAVQRGNAYALANSNYIYDLPSENTSEKNFDKDVPFYQLVVHGYIPYSFDNPGNMAIDFQAEKLKWIEQGAEPTFLITKEQSEKFKDSKVENAFSTEMSSWGKVIEDIAIEFNSKLGFTANHEMIAHDLVAKDVYRIKYSNGNVIYVNYNKSKVTIDNIEIGAADYKVVAAAKDTDR